jgi:hypothetical protein
VPSWHKAYPHLPFVFAGGALASAAGVGLIAAPPAETEPARRLVVAGAAMELYGSRRIETLGLLAEPYTTGPPGRLLAAGRALTVAGVAGALLGRRSRVLSALAGGALVAASAATRFGIFLGGIASAKDPKYTVVPQRERRSAHDERDAVGAGRQQLADDREAGQFPGDEQPARRLRVGEE